MTARSAQIQFWNKLLPGTISNAKRSEYYSTTLRDVPECSVNYDSLSHLPFTDRSIVQENHSRIRIHSGEVCNEIFTGGTTGSPLIVPISQTSQNYIIDFHKRLDEHQSSTRRRGIHLVNPCNAHKLVTPIPARTHEIGVYDIGSFDHAITLLLNPPRESGIETQCTFLIGIERLVRAFTLYATNYYPEGIDSKLEVVLVNSQYVSKHWRRIYENFWRAPVIDRYGLTEVYGGATEDLHTGWYVFDPPCVAEVIDYRTKRRITRGMGEIVLTGLFPFQHEFPIIRYRTGDWALVNTGYSGCGATPAIKPMGRIAASVRTSKNVIPAAIFYEVADALPWIARTSLFEGAKQIRCRQLLGHPKYAATASQNENAVHVEMEKLQCQLMETNVEKEICEDIRNAFGEIMGESWPPNLELIVKIKDNIQSPTFLSYSP